MRRTVMRVLVVFVLLALLGPTGPVLTAAAPAVPQEVGVYEEDFTVYTYKDYVKNADWDIWNSHLTMSLSDAVDQRAPALAPDDSEGGVFVVWKDCRNGTWNIYAQRLDANGNRLWENDLQVNSNGGMVYSNASPAVGASGNGTVIVVWVDERNDDRDIYAQRLDTDGNKLWVADLRVNSDSGSASQESSSVAVDGSGNAVVVWCDDRNGDGDIYAQRLDASGSKLWAADLRVNSDSGTEHQWSPAVGVDWDGNTVVAWEDERNGDKDVYAQRLGTVGNKLWAADLRVNSDSGTERQDSLAVAVDGSGNAVVVWEDYRNGSGWDNPDIYAQRLDASGSKLWAADLRVNSDSGTEHQWSPAVAVGGSGNAVIVWRDFRNDNNECIYGQWLDVSGDKLWATDLHVNWDVWMAGLWAPTVAVDGDGNAIVMWLDPRNGDDDIYGQKLDVDGNRLWINDVRVNSNSGTASQWYSAAAVDSNGNAVVVWDDDRNGDEDIYAQKLDANGNRLWATDVRVNSDRGHTSPRFPAVAVDGDGNAVVVWTDFRLGTADIFAQKLDGSGNKLWPADVCVISGGWTVTQDSPAVAVNDNGIAVVVWLDYRNQYADIYAQRLDAGGSKLWAADVRVNSDSGTAFQSYPAVAMDGTGNTVVVWQDNRDGYPDMDIYAQQLGVSGNRRWANDVCINSDSGVAYQQYPAVAVDGSGNAVIVWQDYRNGSGWEDPDVYAQRMDANGNKLWATDVQVNSGWTTSHQGSSTVAVDSGGDAVIAWYDFRNSNYDIYAQKLNTSGDKAWGGDVRINSDSGTAWQFSPTVGVDESGNAVIAWNDERNGNDDVYAQRLSTSGAKLWASDVQVVYPDFFYLPTGVIQSRAVDTTDDFITEATLTAQYILQGGDVSFYLTNDGGQHWVDVTPGVTHVFTTTGSDLRWRVEMISNPVWRDRSPILEYLRIEYTTISVQGDDYEPDDTCAQASPLQVNGAVQAHTFHQPNDEDWAWFDVTSGTTYVLQTAHTGPNADTVLELHDICDHPILTDTNAFGRDARLVFTAPSDGTFYARVSNHDGSVYGEGTEYDLSVRTYHPNGLAVVVAGHNDRWQLQSNIDYAADQAYLTLLEAGFPKANARYLGPNPDRDVDGNGRNDDIVATATITNVRYAIQDWPREQGLELGVPFYVYLMNHGHYDLFLADGSAGRVTAPLLDLWLSNLEATTGADQITVIIDACKSGSFIDVTEVGLAEISGPNRVIVASTTSQANAYPSERGALFSDVFWTALGDNQDVWSAYRTAKAAVDARGLMQTPWLDDNGDAVANEEDGDLARGRGLAGIFGGSEPVIDWLTVGGVSASGVATVTAQVRDDFNVMGVHVEVYPPGYEEPEAEPGETPVVGVPTATLTLIEENVYMGTLTGLTATGAYRVVGYAVDDEGNWALPAWVMVPSGQAEKKVYLPLVVR